MIYLLKKREMADLSTIFIKDLERKNIFYSLYIYILLIIVYLNRLFLL